MPHSLLNLTQAAEFLRLSEGELRALAVQGEIPCEKRGEQMMFKSEELDLWYSRHVIEAGASPDARPVKPLKQRRVFRTLSELCPRECVCASLRGTTRASIIRELTQLADQSGLLYDPNDLREEIERREELGSTNIGGGIAIPHALVRDEGFFSDSFVCLAKLEKPSFFNSACDGLPTELLILSCSADSEEHLHILRLISNLCRQTRFSSRVREAESDDELYEALILSEQELPEKGI